MCNRGGAVHPGGGHPQLGHDTEADGQDGRGEQRGGEPVDDTWCCCPLGAIAGPDAVSLINGASLDFLARPGKVDGVVQGWEVTTLRLVPPVLLAEAQLMAVTHAAMFSLAAFRHFEKD